jgi:hypothetical protein
MRVLFLQGRQYWPSQLFSRWAVFRQNRSADWKGFFSSFFQQDPPGFTLDLRLLKGTNLFDIFIDL